MKLILVSDNRFWRNALGSEKRILTLYQHLIRKGWAIRVVLVGHLYAEDVELLDRLGIGGVVSPHVDRTPRGTLARGSGSTTGAVTARVKRSLKHLRNLARSLWRCIVHPVSATGVLDQLRYAPLRVREPTLKDYVSPAHIQLLRRLCLEDRPDCILVAYLRQAYILRGIPSGIERPLTVLDTHDVMYERHLRFLVNGEPHELDITATEEASQLSLFDVVLAIQQRDAKAFRALVPATRVVVAGHPHPMRRQPVRRDPQVRVAFFGSSMPPNVRAVRAFLAGPWRSLIARFAREISFHVFGQVCSGLGSIPAELNVTLQGFVEDLDRAYADVDIVVNPVTFGGGLKIKTVEALCYGKPLVTTSVGAEGLEPGMRQAFLVADTDDQTVEALAQLISDPAARASLAERAAAFALKTFSEEAVYAELDRELANFSVRSRTEAASSALDANDLPA